MSTAVPLPVLGQSPDGGASPVVDNSPASPIAFHAVNPAKIRHNSGSCYVYKIPATFFGPNTPGDREVSGSLLENNSILGPPGHSHDLIRKWGRGAYSLWCAQNGKSVGLFFSTPDGSDPRSNGRRYTLVNQPLSHANEWAHLQRRQWLNHSRGRYFLRRGGDRIPPPLFANMGITDICNLQCSICGSQNMIIPVNRRHMDFRIFSMVAQTLFPLLAIVEFNSRGEPLLHPQISEMFEAIYDHGIFARLQTNGTQFQPKKVSRLVKLTGEVSISIDATGDLFEYARAGGKWPQVDEGVRSLMKRRDRDRLGVYLYPTLTAKTIQGAPDLIQWAMEVGIDRVDFHQYEPIVEGIENVPSAQSIDELKQYAARLDEKHPIEIRVNYEIVKKGQLPLLAYPTQARCPNIPRKAELRGADPVYTCLAPVQSVDIDLDGGVCVCCMLQERNLGNALTVEAFADCWFGGEYEAVRRSLMRTSNEALYETCRGCVKQYTA